VSCPHEHPTSSPPLAAALAAAEVLCAERGETWTAPRQRTYELLLRSPTPVSAYDLLAAASRPGKLVHPPTIYRALDFLMTLGLVHRVTGDSTFVACSEPGRPHAPQFLICDCCGRSTEVEFDGVAVALAAARAGFSVSTIIIEAHGLCPDCK